MNLKKLLIVLITVMLSCASAASAASSEALVDRVAKTNDLSMVEARERVNQVFSALTDELKEGSEVGIRGFGTFWLQSREARIAKNPKTGEKVKVPAKRYPKFRSSGVLKEALN